MGLNPKTGIKVTNGLDNYELLNASVPKTVLGFNPYTVLASLLQSSKHLHICETVSSGHEACIRSGLPNIS
jgi:hypothetical protein